jgi:hypothetical protein
MRTTIEFDSDVAVELSRRRREGRGTLREDVNRLVRLGLAHEREGEKRTSKRYSTPTFDTVALVPDVDDVEAAIVRAEGEAHR